MGQYANALAIVTSPDYGLTDLVDNGDTSLIITGYYPIARLKKLDSLQTYINFARPNYAAVGSAGFITSQEIQLCVPKLHVHFFNVDGSGIKVGVLSDSYNTISETPGT